MMVPGERITWQQFGESFIRHVFTPFRIGPEIHRGLPSQVWLKVPATGGEALVVVDMLMPEVTLASDGLLRADLHLKMTIDADVFTFLQADAEIQAVVTLFLGVETRWPLTVFLCARTVTREDVAIDIESASLVFKAAEAMGKIPDLRAELAKAVNAAVVKGITGRVIDVLGRVNEGNPERTAEETGLQTRKTNVAPAVAPGVVPTDGWPDVSPAEIQAAIASSHEAAPAGLAGGPTLETALLVVPGARLGGDLAQGACAYYKIALEKGQQARLRILSRVLGGGRGRGANGLIGFLSPDGEPLNDRMWATSAAGEGSSEILWSFEAPADGEWYFRVKAHHLVGDALRFMILISA